MIIITLWEWVLNLFIFSISLVLTLISVAGFILLIYILKQPKGNSNGITKSKHSIQNKRL
mgnify:FL=1